MDDYISRANAMKPFQDRLEIAEAKFTAGIATVRDAQVAGMSDAALKLLKEISAADVRPVVKAENIGTIAECDQFICSKCGIHLENWVRVEIDEDDGDVTHYEFVMKYCPNCGAYMKGETNGK